MTVAINVFNFLSAESYVRKSLEETKAVNLYHNDVIQYYFTMAEGMGLDSVLDRLVKSADTTVENAAIISAGKKYLDAVRRTRAYDCLPN